MKLATNRKRESGPAAMPHLEIGNQLFHNGVPALQKLNDNSGFFAQQGKGFGGGGAFDKPPYGKPERPAQKGGLDRGFPRRHPPYAIRVFGIIGTGSRLKVSSFLNSGDNDERRPLH